FGIDSRHISDSPLRGRQLELLADQPLVKKPDAPSVAARRRGADNGFDVGRADGEEEAFEECEVEPFVLESEGQMAFKRSGRLVTRGVQTPARLLDDPVAGADGRQRSRYRYRELVGVYQGSVAGRRSLLGKPSFVKNRHRP